MTICPQGRGPGDAWHPGQVRGYRVMGRSAIAPAALETCRPRMGRWAATRSVAAEGMPGYRCAWISFSCHWMCATYFAVPAMSQ